MFKGFSASVYTGNFIIFVSEYCLVANKWISLPQLPISSTLSVGRLINCFKLFLSWKVPTKPILGKIAFQYDLGFDNVKLYVPS